MLTTTVTQQQQKKINKRNNKVKEKKVKMQCKNLCVKVVREKESLDSKQTSIHTQFDYHFYDY